MSTGDEASVGVSGEEPGVDEVGFPGADEGAEFPDRDGVEFESLVEEIDGDAGGGESCGVGSGASEDGDPDVELVARESGGEESELLLGSRFVEGGDDQEQTYHGAKSGLWVGASRRTLRNTTCECFFESPGRQAGACPTGRGDSMVHYPSVDGGNSIAEGETGGRESILGRECVI